MRCIEYWAFNWETDVWLNSRENDNRANTAATTTAHTHTHNSQWKTNLLSLSLVGWTFKMTLQMRACQSDQVLKSIQIVCMWICLNEPAEAILFRCFKYIFDYLSLFFPIWFGLWFFNPFCCCLNFIFHNFFAISPYLRHIVHFIFTLFLISFQVFLPFGMWQLQEFRKHYEIHISYRRRNNGNNNFSFDFQLQMVCTIKPAPVILLFMF